jgi:membrane protein DedA with SNARE-associated domain
MASTLISEDLTCVAAGQFIGRGDMAWVVGIGECFAGIFLGDLGLWLIGRLVVRRVISWPWAARMVATARRVAGQASFNDRVGAIIVGARFVPGLRLPTYVALGAAGVGMAAFSVWTFIAAAVWTPLIVLLVAHVGDPALKPLEAYLSASGLLIVSLFIGVGAIRIVTLPLTRIGRAKLVASVSRIWRWEFWPSWLFYLPLIPWIAWLSLRHRGFMTITAANPGIPYGGFVGESKHQILRSLDSEHVSPTILIRAGRLDDRIAKFDRSVGYRFPVILKPDAGQRGAGVKLVRTRDELLRHLRNTHDDVLIQPYHPGPYEAGVFYYRIPGEPTGRILSITAKHFPELVGDGRSTIEQLVWRHPRYRMQARVFLTRHAADAQRVLAKAERFRLAMAGNHCQGTMFCDGSHLLTVQLEQKIDQIARTFDGFFFGRLDVRYSDPERFKLGQDLTIIELNGVTSESTNLYDPSWSLLRAYRMLFRQWSILFQIGAANRSRGERVNPTWELIREITRFYSSRKTVPLAD